jgi:hypothetical protein
MALKLYQRPIPQKSQGIGMWLNLLEITSILAIYSNALFF